MICDTRTSIYSVNTSVFSVPSVAKEGAATCQQNQTLVTGIAIFAQVPPGGVAHFECFPTSSS
jgi:hypothetical protein